MRLEALTATEAAAGKAIDSEDGACKGRLESLAKCILSFPALMALGVVVVTVLTVSNRFDDPDLWWHLKLGQVMTATHSIPSRDLFSFTVPGQPSIVHEWLSEVSLYGAYAAAGYRGLMAWLCLFASAIFVSVFVLCYLTTRNALVSLLGALVAWFFGTVGLAIRPLILGHLLLALELLALELGRSRDRRWLWCLPPIFALWPNVHGSYYFGMAVLALYWVCAHIRGQWGLVVSAGWPRDRRRLLGLMLPLSGAALCVNPIGPRLLLYPFVALFGAWVHPSGVNMIQEWMPPDLGSPRGIALLAVIGAVFLIGVLRRRELPLAGLALVLATFAFASQHARMLFLFGIVAAPLIGALLSPEIESGMRREHPLANAILMLAGLALIWGGFPSSAAIEEQIESHSPVGAVNYIRQAGLHGPMLNEWIFGGYLLWALPEEKVFIDGREDAYDAAGVTIQYGRWITLSEDPTLLLEKYHIRLCVVSKDAPMAQVMTFLPGWHKAYSDRVASVFTR